MNKMLFNNLLGYKLFDILTPKDESKDSIMKSAGWSSDWNRAVILPAPSQSLLDEIFPSDSDKKLKSKLFSREPSQPSFFKPDKTARLVVNSSGLAIEFSGASVEEIERAEQNALQQNLQIQRSTDKVGCYSVIFTDENLSRLGLLDLKTKLEQNAVHSQANASCDDSKESGSTFGR